MKIFYTFLLILLSFFADAQFVSPGTGITYTPAGLVAATGGIVTFTGGNYIVNGDLTISANDRLEILTNETFKFGANNALTVLGTLRIEPPTRVLFTAQNPLVSYNGVRVEGGTGNIIKKLTFEYAVSFRVFSCSPVFDNCVFQNNNNNASTSYGNGAMSLFNGNPIITNSIFTNNRRAAIQGGANIANAPTIINCYFAGNNTDNQNVPQVNLGASGTDTTKIIGCQFYSAAVRSGAIAFLPLGNLNTVIKNNYIKSNRYGITLSGGNNINALIAYNRIEDNNIENNPALGGSGISLSGGSATSHQNTTVTGNLLKGNLWGITILNFAKPNLGNTANADTSDNGKNMFINNTNTSDTQCDLYNNTPDDISAQGNYWNTTVPAEIETHIFHKADNAAYGLVTYSSFIVPFIFDKITATPIETDVLLKWSTVSETLTQSFGIERGTNGTTFTPVATVAAAGTSAAAANYTYTDVHAGPAGTRVYYRLKMTDLFGHTSYSPVVFADLYKLDTFNVIKVYPSPARSSENIYAEIPAGHSANIAVGLYDAAGRLVSKQSIPAAAGSAKIILNKGILLPPGIVFIKIDAGNYQSSFKIFVK